MLPIHLPIKKDDLRPFTGYAQVKDGYVNVLCDGDHGLIRLPVDLVFGADTCPPDAEFYIDADKWRTLKMDKAKTLVVERTETVWRVQNITHGLTIDCPSSMPEGGNYPDVLSVLPDFAKLGAAVTCIGVNPSLLVNMLKATGSDGKQALLFFDTPRRAIIVKYAGLDERVQMIIMPMHCDEYRLAPDPQPTEDHDPLLD